MPWQDWVLSIGGFVLLASLMPTVIGPHKPALTTSIMSATIIFIFGVTLATLGLWLTAVANVGNSIAWTVLAVQRYSMMKQERAEPKITIVRPAAPSDGGPDDAGGPQSFIVTEPVRRPHVL